VKHDGSGSAFGGNRVNLLGNSHISREILDQKVLGVSLATRQAI
jgi:hypothetical protein